jgi:hypothetical protein
MIATHKDLARKLEVLEKKYDARFRVVFDAIRELMAPPEPNKRKIGSLLRNAPRGTEEHNTPHFDVFRII